MDHINGIFDINVFPEWGVIQSHCQVIRACRAVFLESAAQFLETVRNLPGVEFVTSFVVLKSYKPFYEVSI